MAQAFEDDYVMLRGKRRSNAIGILRQKDDLADGVIALAGEARDNAKVLTMDFCVAKSVDCPELGAVTFALEQGEGVDRISGDVAGTVLKPFFDDFRAANSGCSRPVHVGDVLPVPYMGTNMRFVVTSVVAAGAETMFGVVVPETTLELSPERVEASRDASMVRYSDIGGLRPQLGVIRETIELPLRMPKLYSTLGVKPPKGVLMSGSPGCGKTLIAKAMASEANVFFFDCNGGALVASKASETESNVRKVFAECTENAPAILFIDEVDALAPNRDKAASASALAATSAILTQMDGVKSEARVMVLAATNRPNALDPAVRRAGRFDTEVVIPVPDRVGRKEILQIFIKRKGLKILKPVDADRPEETHDAVDVDRLAEDTHGYTGSDLASLCTKAALHAMTERVATTVDLEAQTIDVSALDDHYVLMSDFLAAMVHITPSGMRDVAIQKPNVTFNDIGGLEEVKQELREMIEMPVRFADMFEDMGITPPKGAFLYGPPGCGKTMMAKAIANECGCNFIAIKGPQLLSKWVGESEENVRDIFSKARNSSPCVIFFDELDSIAAKRGNSEGQGPGDSVVNQLLTEMDGVQERKNVFVIGASNFIDSVDPAVLRTGRMDQFIYIGLPDCVEACEKVLRACLRKTPLEADGINMHAIAEWCFARGLSPADIAGMCKLAGKEAVIGHLDKHGFGFNSDGSRKDTDTDAGPRPVGAAAAAASSSSAAGAADAAAAAAATSADRHSLAATKSKQDDAVMAIGAPPAMTAATLEAAAAQTKPSVSDADRARYETERAKYKVQLTTDTSAGPFAGEFVITDPERLRFQPYGRIDVREKDEGRPPTPPPAPVEGEPAAPAPTGPMRA